MILPPATLGMLGGGQLGRFFVSAAHELGYQVWVLDPDKNSPAGQIAERHFCVDYSDYAVLDEFAAGCAAITTEFENVPADTLDYLAKFVPVRPHAAAVAVCQNRIVEKSFLRDNGFPHGPFVAVNSENDLKSAPASLFPAILKVARLGYDGKGQATVNSVEEALIAFGHFKGEHCVLEQRLSLDYEVSVVLARDQDGKIACFPTGENQHTRGILDVSIVPARTTGCVKSDAEEIAARIAEKLGYIGTMGVEFFVNDGALVVNEMAPRPHNSGHYTLNACDVSQFELQVRAMAGLPLVAPRLHSPTVMLNILGDLWFHDGQPRTPDWAAILALPGTHLHLYGKLDARPGRKMGHLNITGATLAQVQDTAAQAARILGIAPWH